jgi:hypothetical protein
MGLSPQELRRQPARVLRVSRTLVASFLVLDVVLIALRRDLSIRQGESS